MSTTLITGANRGIGLALATQLQAEGAEVLAICRKSSAELDALGVEVFAGIDVSNDADLARLQSLLQRRTLEQLILNAGVLSDERLGALDASAVARLRRQLEVNALAPLLCVEALLTNLAAGAKIGIITSKMGSVGDNDSGGRYGYRMSKAALNAAAKSLAIDLKPRGIAVAILHPGFVRTQMTGGNGELSAEQSAGLLLERMRQLNLSNSGTFWHARGDVLPW